MTVVYLIPAVAIAAWLVWRLIMGSGATVDCAALEAELKGSNPPVLVDVRTESEFKGGHIPGAINVPLDRLGEIIVSAGPRDSDIVVYCHSGMRSGNAQKKLAGMGYSRVRNLRGGIAGWRGKVVR